jgi:hypothetical protein
VLIYVCGWFGLIPSPEFPFDPASERLGLSGSVCVGTAVALAMVAGFLTRPLHAPSPRTASVAAPAALFAATLAAFGLWLVNPYLGLLVAVGLQAWVAAAARVGAGLTRLALPRFASLPAVGLVAAGLIPVLGAVIALAGRFDAGLSVGADLLFMFTGGQLPMIVALLGSVFGGAGLAIIALDGPPRPGRSGDGEPQDEAPAEPSAEPAAEPPAEERPPQPERDPRLWSKPANSGSSAGISRPSPAIRTAPWPSPTTPISVSP